MAKLSDRVHRRGLSVWIEGDHPSDLVIIQGLLETTIYAGSNTFETRPEVIQSAITVDGKGNKKVHLSEAREAARREVATRWVAKQCAKGYPITRLLARPRQVVIGDTEVRIPGYMAFREWLNFDPSLAQIFARAKITYAHLLVDRATETVERDDLTPADKTVRAQHYRWVAERMDPESWGTRTAVDLTTKNAGELSDQELSRRIDELQSVLKGTTTVQGEGVEEPA